MASVKRMPAVMVMLVFSWFFFISGFFAGVYLLLIKPMPSSLLWGALAAAGGIFLWGAVRVAANSCQILFELKGLDWETRKAGEAYSKDMLGGLAGIVSAVNAQHAGSEQRLDEVKRSLASLNNAIEVLSRSVIEQGSVSNNHLAALNKAIDALSRSSAEQEKALSAAIDKQRAGTEQRLEEVKGLLASLNNILEVSSHSAFEQGKSSTEMLSAGIREIVDRLTQAMREEKDALRQAMREDIDKLAGNLAEICKGMAALDANFRSAAEEVSGSLSSWEKGAKELNSSIGENLSRLRDIFEQMNCDSKDVNQNIEKIKVFFEAIEKHLDLHPDS